MLTYCFRALAPPARLLNMMLSKGAVTAVEKRSKSGWGPPSNREMWQVERDEQYFPPSNDLDRLGHGESPLLAPIDYLAQDTASQKPVVWPL